MLEINNLKNKWFTLVELIVIITILTILWVVWFISFQGYIVNARDSIRITDISNIKKSLWYVKEITGYPIPDNWFEITFSGSEVFTEWEFGENSKRITSSLNKLPVDPLTWDKYTYSILNNRQEFEIWTILEWNSIKITSFVSEQSYANDFDYNAYISWNFNQRVAKVVSWSKEYVLALPSIIITDKNNNNLENIIKTRNLVLKWQWNLPHSYNIPSNLSNSWNYF